MVLKDEREDATDEVDPDRRQRDANELVSQARVRRGAGAHDVANFPGHFAHNTNEVHVELFGAADRGPVQKQPTTPGTDPRETKREVATDSAAAPPWRPARVSARHERLKALVQLGADLEDRAAEVARFSALQGPRFATLCHPALVNGAAGIVIQTKRGPSGAVGFTVTHGRIATIDLILDPSVLSAVDFNTLA